MESKVGSILALIGGILQLVSAVVFLILALIILMTGVGESTAFVEGVEAVGTIMGIVYIIIAVVYVVMGILVIKASRLMKVAETTKKGGVMALVCGIIGFNIVTIIGGVLGLVDASK